MSGDMFAAEYRDRLVVEAFESPSPKRARTPAKVADCVGCRVPQRVTRSKTKAQEEEEEEEDTLKLYLSDDDLISDVECDSNCVQESSPKVK